MQGLSATIRHGRKPSCGGKPPSKPVLLFSALTRQHSSAHHGQGAKRRFALQTIALGAERAISLYDLIRGE